MQCQYFGPHKGSWPCLENGSTKNRCDFAEFSQVEHADVPHWLWWPHGHVGRVDSVTHLINEQHDLLLVPIMTRVTLLTKFIAHVFMRIFLFVLSSLWDFVVTPLLKGAFAYAMLVELFGHDHSPAKCLHPE